MTSARLLLVSSDAELRKRMSHALREHGYEVVDAAAGHTGLDILRDSEYDLVLLDHDLPDATGTEILVAIRETWPAADLPVIMVMNAGQEARAVRALQLGANDYVSRSAELATVMARVETRLKLAFASREQRRSADLYRLAASALDQGLWEWDLDGRTVTYSERWKSLLGFSDGEIGSSPEEWFERVHPQDRSRLRSAIQAHLDGTGAGFTADYRMLHKDGHYGWVEVRGSASRDAMGRATRLAGHQIDINTQKTIDPVTSLPSRTWLIEELGALSSGGSPATLILLKLAGLDLIEESLPDGEPGSLLSAIAARLQSVVAGTPGATVCRSSERQFAVLLRQAASPSASTEIAERIFAALSQPFTIENDVAYVSAAAGIAEIQPGMPPDSILRDANAAARRAWERGSGHCAVFHAGIRQQELEELRLENDLRRALGRSEFVVHYQPKVDLLTGEVIDCEALVRWRRNGSGLVPPMAFMALAERTGLIVPIGKFVLEQACSDTVYLRRRFPKLGVSVNVSGRQFRECDLVELVRTCLATTGMEPRALRLEVTETFLVEDPDKAFATLARLRDLGIGLKLDDFGSGYSSLSYLQRFPFDTLKIDRSFISRLGVSRETVEIVRAIIGLADSLRMSLIAEGIETPEQLEQLKRMGCRFGQGYWFSPPVDLAHFEALLEGWHGSRYLAPALAGERQGG